MTFTSNAKILHAEVELTLTGEYSVLKVIFETDREHGYRRFGLGYNLSEQIDRKQF